MSAWAHGTSVWWPVERESGRTHIMQGWIVRQRRGQLVIQVKSQRYVVPVAICSLTPLTKGWRQRAGPEGMV